MSSHIPIKTADDVVVLKQAARLLSDIVNTVVGSIHEGITTKDVDLLTEKLIVDAGCQPAFKGYRGYPASACVSINHEVVHGIPSDKRRLKNGDIVSIDVGLVYRSYYADMAKSVGVGTIAPNLQRLLEITQTALYQGIEQARAGRHLSDISHAIQVYVETNGFSVVRDFVGHGIGKNLHEEPEILNYGPSGCGPVLQPGMVFCIEPMVNIGDWQTVILEDGWTVETKDGKPSAHFEHMVLVTENDPEILTEDYG